MTQPTPYNRQFSFTNDQTSNPSTKTPGNQLDAEFNAVLTTFSQVLANLVLIQRDDGQLGNQTVGAAQLKAELSGGISPATQWLTLTSYGVNTTVFNGLKLYRCLINHISGVFATDLAAGDWTLLADFSSAITSQTAGVVNIGGQVGVFTIPGGGLGSAVLPVARYDAAQSLTSGQQLQLANNALVVSALAQSLTTGQQAQAATNIGAVTGAGVQSLTGPQQLQVANNILVASAAGGQSLTGPQQVQAANNLLVPTGGGAQSLSSAQALQARNNLLMSTSIGLIEMWPTSRVPVGRLKCNGASLSRATFADLFTAIIASGAATFTNASANVGMVNHGLSVGDPVKLFTTGTLPTNFTAGTHGLITVGTNYFVQSVVDGNTVTLSATAGGSAITAGSAGSGTHTWVNAPYGDGDGSTTFTAPDYRGYFLRGWDNSAGIDTNRAPGVLQADQMIAHTHGITENPHSHTIKGGSGAGGGLALINSGAGTFANDDHTSTATTGITINSAGAGTETRPKNYPVLYTIRYAA